MNHESTARILYEGKAGDDGLPSLTADLTPLNIHEAQEVQNCASGYRWGKLCHGSDQTAVAIVFHHLRSFVGMRTKAAIRATLKTYKAFARNVVSCLPEMWMMESRGVEEARIMIMRQDSGHDVSWPLWRASAFERGVLITTKGRPLIRGATP